MKLCNATNFNFLLIWSGSIVLILTLLSPPSLLGIATSPLKSKYSSLFVKYLQAVNIPACNISGITTPLLGFKFPNSLFELLGNKSLPLKALCDEYSDEPLVLELAAGSAPVDAGSDDG